MACCILRINTYRERKREVAKDGYPYYGDTRSSHTLSAFFVIYPSPPRGDFSVFLWKNGFWKKKDGRVLKVLYARDICESRFPVSFFISR